MARASKQPDIRRQELLDIGISLYFKDGEKGVSIQRVVAQANVATGLFYYYFHSKDAFLDEALNDYIDKEIHSLEVLLQSNTQTAAEKLDTVWDAFFEYAGKMALHRTSKSFHTERHYILTERLIYRLEKTIQTLLKQGVDENTFQVETIDLTASFILHGISSVFDPAISINKTSLEEVKRLTNRILERS